MENVITIQDSYIAKVKRYDPKGYNHSALTTKARKSAREALITLGFSDSQAREMVMQADDVARLEVIARG